MFLVIVFYFYVHGKINKSLFKKHEERAREGIDENAILNNLDNAQKLPSRKSFMLHLKSIELFFPNFSSKTFPQNLLLPLLHVMKSVEVFSVDEFSEAQLTLTST